MTWEFKMLVTNRSSRKPRDRRKSILKERKKDELFWAFFLLQQKLSQLCAKKCTQKSPHPGVGINNKLNIHCKT